MVVHAIGSTVPLCCLPHHRDNLRGLFRGRAYDRRHRSKPAGVSRADGRGYCGTRGLFTAFSAGVIIAQLGAVAALLVFTAMVMIGLGTAALRPQLEAIVPGVRTARPQDADLAADVRGQ